MSNQNLSSEAQIALIQQEIESGFKSINEKLDTLASKSALELAVKDRNNALDKHESRLSYLEFKANRPLVGTALISSIITAVVTFLLMHFLNSLH